MDREIMQQRLQKVTGGQKLEDLHNELIELIAESDENLMEIFL